MRSKLRAVSIVVIFLSTYPLTVMAFNLTVVEGYLLMAKARDLNIDNQREYLWTNTVSNKVDQLNKNWNRPVTENWGVSDRYPGTQGMPIPLVKPYSETDPGFAGPNGEHYGVEIEFGDSTITPREPNSKSVRLYTDFGQTGASTSGMTRAEIHIRTTLQDMKVSEGDTLWLGWSELYSDLDREKITTVFQFRNQPNEQTLAEAGFSATEIEQLVDADVNKGGPAVGITTTPVDGTLRYQFNARVGTTLNWQVPQGHKHITSFPITENKWYDFVVQMKYSQNSSGRFRIWIYEHNNNEVTNYSINDIPEWDFHGATMYLYPSDYIPAIASPEIRLGVYRHERVNVIGVIAEKNRYMTKYLGPLRLWSGDDDNGFNYVAPR